MNKKLTFTILMLLGIFTVFVVWGGLQPQSVNAQGTLTWFTVADITGNGAALALGTGSARICQLTALTTNAAAVRWGDSLIGAARGSAIAPGGGQFIPPGGVGSAYVMDLATTYVFAQTGDKVALTCAK